MRRWRGTFALLVLVESALAATAAAQTPRGYFRFPAIHGDTVVFTAEGDLWRVGLAGGVAQRLTTHPGQETRAAISPDGKNVAFSADYEGPTEVYVMPLAGGIPQRLTYHGDEAEVAGWTPGGEILYTTRHFSTLPDAQLVRYDLATGEHRLVPLSQASDGVYDDTGTTLFFTRLPFQGSFTKRYRGGTVQSLWRYGVGVFEAAPLTADYAGTSREPMFWQGRIYFTSDRDGTMNVWSMTAYGQELRQHTHHAGWDVKSPSLHDGRIVYQLGADLRLLDLRSGEDRQLAVALASDFDQMRERWVEKPMDFLTDAHLSPAGERVALTARGRVFVAPAGQGRRVEAGGVDGVRLRGARFLDDESLVVLSDESGEVELWRFDPRGVKARDQLTRGGEGLRFAAIPAPDGKRVAYTEKDNELWLVDLASGRQTKIATSPSFGFGEVSWSPDSRWLAFTVPAANFMSRIQLYRVSDGKVFDATSDRFDSFAPAWSPDGKWLYFLSDRNLESLARSPWGSYQPAPYLARRTKVYLLPLRAGERSPFAPRDELAKDEEEEEEKSDKAEEDETKEEERDKEPPAVVIDLDGLAERHLEAPVAPGSYTALAVGDKHLFWLASDLSSERKQTLMAMEIRREEPEAKAVLADVQSFELSADRQKVLVRQEQALYVVDAGDKAPDDLEKTRVKLDGWRFPLDPREEWRQMFLDAWRLERDYFYDPGMHGVDWRAMLAKYLPLVDRVTDRAELSDVFGDLIGELSTLHHFVYGGDQRADDLEVAPASLGAVLARDEAAGGHRIVTLYRGDPDLPEERSPLARPEVGASEGDVVVAVNGTPALTVRDVGALLRDQAGAQVLLALKDGDTGAVREAVVTPLTPDEASELRYDAWEYRRRQIVEKAGDGQIGYVHLRAMGSRNYSEWARHFFPVFNRPGLIIDVRHNRGGNIDSWILGSLLRKPWMWWQPRYGVPYSNMQFAADSHMVVLCDEFTASDGEAFTEGFRRLGLGKVIGARTWGGEVWLTSDNFLVDKGIATAAEFGVYGPEGQWLIEGHGVDPDIVVDNPPSATYAGNDPQLETAISYLLDRIREAPPVFPPQPPPYPDKSFKEAEN